MWSAKSVLEISIEIKFILKKIQINLQIQNYNMNSKHNVLN